jgi:hypothetical protein
MRRNLPDWLRSQSDVCHVDKNTEGRVVARPSVHQGEMKYLKMRSSISWGSAYLPTSEETTHS